MSERITLTEAERGLLLDAVMDDLDRQAGYSVLGPGGTNGQTPTVYEAIERILADRLAAATADYERRLDHAHDNHLRLRAALDAEPTWVCDTCMLRVHRDQIAVWADGEHVVCQWCRRDEAEVESLRATVARVKALADEWHYKGEFGWGPWQEGYGPDHEGEVLDRAATALRAALGGEPS